MKKLLFVLGLVFAFALVLTGCKEPGLTPSTPLSEEAKLKVTVSPNPVPYTSEGWIATITISEINGIGVTINSLTIDKYDESGSIAQSNTYTATSSEGDTEELYNFYLPGNGHITFPFKWTRCMGIYSKLNYTLSGKDVNGSEVEITFTITLQAP